MSVDMPERFERVRTRIAQACAAAHRSPAEVLLLAISKGQPAAAIEQAYHLGQRHFGENYVQELADKAAQLAHLSDIQWHFVGHLQRNKVKACVPIVQTVHTVDSSALAARLNAAAHAQRKRVEVYLQVNVAAELTKSGCSPDHVPLLIEHVHQQSQLDLVGLMAIPPALPPEAARHGFAQLAQLAKAHSLPGLSMGMSDDFEQAIAEGSTCVRVGSALLGPRQIAAAGGGGG